MQKVIILLLSLFVSLSSYCRGDRKIITDDISFDVQDIHITVDQDVQSTREYLTSLKRHSEVSTFKNDWISDNQGYIFKRGNYNQYILTNNVCAITFIIPTERETKVLPLIANKIKELEL